MFWIFLLLAVLMVTGCYVAYKEAKHHELHKLRAEFSDIYKKHNKSLEDIEENDPEIAVYFKGEIAEIKEVLEIVEREDEDCDLIQELNEDLAKIKEKIARLFKR